MRDSLQVSKAYHDHQSKNFIRMEDFDDDNNNASGMPNSADERLFQAAYKRVNLDNVCVHANSQSLTNECDFAATYDISYTKLREVYYIRSNIRSRCQ
jgi:hypothetical protein